MRDSKTVGKEDDVEVRVSTVTGGDVRETNENLQIKNYNPSAWNC